MKIISITKSTIFRSAFAIMLCAPVGSGIWAQQNIGLGTTTPHASAILDISVNDHGVLVPRIDLQSFNDPAPIVSPAQGLLVFNSAGSKLNGPGFYYWDGNWKKLGGSNLYWRLTGNVGTTAGIGTTDNVDFVIKRNNVRAGWLGLTNTSLGNAALSSALLNGIYNSAFGASALLKNTTGSYNSAFGVKALQENTAGAYNTAVGYEALYNNTVGDSNVAIGNSALYANTIGSRNTAVGHYAMSGPNIGTKNTAIGYNAQVGPNLNYATAIGANSNVTTSNSLVIGGTGSSAVRVIIRGDAPAADLDIRQSTLDTAGIRLVHSGGVNHWRIAFNLDSQYCFFKNGVLKGYINKTNGKYVKVSDERLKTNFSPLDNLLPHILQLRPTTYYYNDNEPGAPLSYGFLAQEMEQVFPNIVSTKENGEGMKAIRYDQVAVLAVEGAKEQQGLIIDQTRRLETLRNRVEKLEAKNK